MDAGQPKESNMSNMPKLPSLPKLKSVNKCACGCKGLTQSRFVPGHDSKLYGMVKRIEHGVWAKGGDVTAQLDAIANWDGFGPEFAQAAADHMGIEWSADAWIERLEAAEKVS